MNAYSFSLGNAIFHALGSGALHWPVERMLIVSDLHFGKPDRIARRGGTLLPPYANHDTLLRLEAEIENVNAKTVVCLGDSFDDLQASEDLIEDERLWLIRLMAGRQWVWISGNHDPSPATIGGTHLAHLSRNGVSFRHIASTTARVEISGHYHPKARLIQQRPCFLIDSARVIMPAFGTYTGGLAADAPVLRALMLPNARAVLTGAKVVVMPFRGVRSGPIAQSLSDSSG